jgi:hypothetical protein
MTSPTPAGTCSPTPVLGIPGGAVPLGEEVPPGVLDGALLGEGAVVGEGALLGEADAADTVTVPCMTEYP